MFSITPQNILPKPVRRILHLIPTLEGGGAERQLTYLCTGLCELGWDVHVGLIRLGTNTPYLKATGARIHQIHCKGNYDPMILWQVIRLIRRLRPSIVQTWLPMMEVLGGISCLLTKTAYIISERISTRKHWDWWKQGLSRVLASRAMAVIANSVAGRRYWEAQPLHPACFVVANGLPLEEIDESTCGNFRDLGIEDRGFHILFAGRLDEQKSPESLIRAMPLVSSEIPDAVAIICGKGPLRTVLEKMVIRYALQDKVFFLGYVEYLWSLMKMSHVLVSPSLYEGCPNVVMEAMACGCPLVVSDVLEHRELLGEESALFVSPYRPNDIAKAIIEVLRHPEAAAIRARNAQRKAVAWSIKVMAQRHHMLYFNLLSRKRDGRRNRITRS